MSKEPQSNRLSAAERREEIIEAAVLEFATNGYAGSSTQAISDRVGVSQPYLFKLFGSKKRLFLAAYDHVTNHIHDTLMAAAEAHPEDPDCAMEAAYSDLTKQRHNMLLLLQAYAAAADQEIAEHVRDKEIKTFNEIMEMMEGDAQAAREWLALGILEAIGAVLGIPQYRE